MAVNAFAEDTTDVTVLTSGDCGYNGAAVTYTLTSYGVFTVDGSGYMASYQLTSSGQPTMPWKDYRSSIKKIVINEGVKSVSYYGFTNFTNLESVELASTVTQIDPYAFRGCTKLATINTENITYFGEACLAYCEGLSQLDLTSAEEVGINAFAYCTSVNTINFG